MLKILFYKIKRIKVAPVSKIQQSFLKKKDFFLLEKVSEIDIAETKLNFPDFLMFP